MSASREKKQRQGGISDKVTQADQKQAAYKRKVRTYTAIGVVVVVLVAALLIWNSGFFQSRATAATIGGEKLTAAELSYYYYDQRYTYVYAGLIDTSVPDDEQILNEEEGTTYHDFFVEQAIASAQSVQARYDAALEAGYTEADIQDDLDATMESLESSAASQGTSVKGILVSSYGKYMTKSIFERLTAKSLLANLYSNDKLEEFYDSYTSEELEAYYEEHKDSIDDFEYSYLYFTPADVEDTDEDGNELSDEEIEELEEQALADAKEKAEEALAAYEEGDTDVAALIEEYEPNTSGDHSVVTGSTSLSSGYREELLELDEGEAALVENGESGYYVVIFHSRGRNEDLSADIRHILFQAVAATDEEGNLTAPTEEEWESAKAEADKVLAEYEAGDKTAEAFGELANEYSDDASSNTEGGLYENVTRGQFVDELDQWIFDQEHQAGDVDIVRHEGDLDSLSSYWGYHLIYFQGWGEAEWVMAVREDMSADDTTAWEDELVENGNYEGVAADGAKYLGT